MTNSSQQLPARNGTSQQKTWTSKDEDRHLHVAEISHRLVVDDGRMMCDRIVNVENGNFLLAVVLTGNTLPHEETAVMDAVVVGAESAWRARSVER
jgi:hypothetical protein